MARVERGMSGHRDQQTRHDCMSQVRQLWLETPWEHGSV